MREILFRGKRVDNCEWAYGYYTVGRVTDDHVIEGKECNRVVIPETVGQYTGLNDKNGNRIFEGDILRHIDYPDEPMQLVWYVNGYALKGLWMDGEWPKILSKIEVAGNIHDNPELLKEGK